MDEIILEGLAILGYPESMLCRIRIEGLYWRDDRSVVPQKFETASMRLRLGSLLHDQPKPASLTEQRHEKERHRPKQADAEVFAS